MKTLKRSELQVQKQFSHECDTFTLHSRRLTVCVRMVRSAAEEWSARRLLESFLCLLPAVPQLPSQQVVLLPESHAPLVPSQHCDLSTVQSCSVCPRLPQELIGVPGDCLQV